MNVESNANSSGQVTLKIELADFPRRLAATLIDFTLLIILMFLLKTVFPGVGNALFFNQTNPGEGYDIPVWVLSKSSLIGIWIIYSMLMDCANMQGTFGKQMMAIVVTDENGKRITFARSFGRNILKSVSYAIVGLGFFWILFDKRNKGWHDRWANTLVIRR